MANNYFHFKQFTIHQHKAAMRVTTDACVFGAWVNKQIAERTLSAERMLDIGTGTGLLALMLAQQNAGKIDAVEIDKDAFDEASENFRNAKLKSNIQLHHADIKHFAKDERYDIIVCNPPFFKQSLNSPDKLINLARHEDDLSLPDMLSIIKEKLEQNGSAFMLLPYERRNEFETEIVKHALYIHSVLVLKHSEVKTPIRVMFGISHDKQKLFEETVVIKNSENVYTEDFSHLMYPYYLDK